MVDNLDPYEVVKCKGCGKDVFPSERNIALKAIWCGESPRRVIRHS